MIAEASSRLTLDKRFRGLEYEYQRLLLQQERSLHDVAQTPKIQKVPSYLRDRENFTEHYLPKLVSFGPIHHGDSKLQHGEKYKLMWTAMYMKDTKQDARDMHRRIVDNIKEIKDLFTDDLFTVAEFTSYESLGFNSIDEKLSWILLVDGCSMLQILDKGNLNKPSDYCELNLKLDQLILLQQDMLLLENQIPYRVLQLLSRQDDQNVDAKLKECMDEFLSSHHLWPVSTSKMLKKKRGSHATSEPPSEDIKLGMDDEKPLAHLLDHFRRAILNDFNEDPNDKKSKYESKSITHRNLKELQESGISVKGNNLQHWPTIKFSGGHFCGELRLPAITVDDTTEPTLLNLIAYEMCPSFTNNYEISSFVAFLDSLIDHPEDVKVLRGKGVLRNALGSDEEVSKLFNTISKDLVTGAGNYGDVREAIEQHYKDTGKKWVAELRAQNLRSPWAIIGLLTAIILVVLTFVQTAYTVK